MRYLWFIFFLALCLVLPIGCASTITRSISQSHVAANEPSKSDFDALLQRDLTKYFGRVSGKGATVQYELLRQGPTQSGISYPKYYLWVKISRSGKLVTEGAVRCAAIDRTRFEVTDYVAKATLLSDFSEAKMVFPAPVCDRIALKMKG